MEKKQFVRPWFTQREMYWPGNTACIIIKLAKAFCILFRAILFSALFWRKNMSGFSKNYPNTFSFLIFLLDFRKARFLRTKFQWTPLFYIRKILILMYCKNRMSILKIQINIRVFINKLSTSYQQFREIVCCKWFVVFLTRNGWILPGWFWRLKTMGQSSSATKRRGCRYWSARYSTNSNR